ncbi:MAG: hypothetical protein FWC54_00805 [Actinomycetia bacterium]|nr:hypothetical protein [Actinomycetes bacterium]
MKKSLIVLAFATLFVFAFAAVAGAKYAGYALDGSRPTPAGPDSTTPGYLSWGGASKLMSSNGVSASLQSTAHGGYVTTTTKCAVCHSAHRATGAGATVGAIKNQFLTTGGSSCVQCHTAWGSTNSGLLVEWGNTTNSGGPHAFPARGCGLCHGGGIHGGSNSAYHGMNAFMLGGAQDAVIAADLPNQVARQVVGNGQNFAGQPLVAMPVEGANYAANNWFINGQSGPTAAGAIPSGDLALPGSAAANMTAAQYAAARSLLTGYTCSRAGCHINSVFANLTWGMTYEREQLGAGTGMMKSTGHSSAPGANSNHANSGTGANSCGPCHPGNAAGGYRLTSGQAQARAYGCDQCHDAVGKATNSTAFPHGNRNIEIYQWANGAPGASAYAAPTTIVASSANLWMYTGNIAGRTNSVSTLADPSVTLIQGAVGPNAAGDPGIIADAVCLKCHVPADVASSLALGAPAGAYVQAGINNRHARPTSFPTDISALNPYSGSTNWIYLWR